MHRPQLCKTRIHEVMMMIWLMTMIAAAVGHDQGDGNANEAGHAGDMVTLAVISWLGMVVL